jgi:undecaprenyl-phosphate 4-deoxy-4-formamido-L-arabinose transferase
MGSYFANSVATILINKPSDLYLSSFKIIRTEVLTNVINYRGPFPYLDGLLLRVTNNFSSCIVEHRKRELGASSYTLRKLVRLWLNMFLNFSALPLRVILFLGVLCFSLGFCLSLVAIIEWFFSSKVPQGYTSVFISVLLLSGVQLVSLGVIGEYLGKLFLHYNGTPQWIIKESSFGESRAIHAKSDARDRISPDGAS